MSTCTGNHHSLTAGIPRLIYCTSMHEMAVCPLGTLQGRKLSLASLLSSTTEDSHPSVSSFGGGHRTTHTAHSKSTPSPVFPVGRGSRHMCALAVEGAPGAIAVQGWPRLLGRRGTNASKLDEIRDLTSLGVVPTLVAVRSSSSGTGVQHTRTRTTNRPRHAFSVERDLVSMYPICKREDDNVTRTS